jgi:hypothetical protein
VIESRARPPRADPFPRCSKNRTRDAAAAAPTLARSWLRLTASERVAHAANPVVTRIGNAAVAVRKDGDTGALSARPRLAQPTIRERTRGEGSEPQSNGRRVGTSGTGKTRRALGLGQAACGAGPRARFVTAAGLVSRRETEPNPDTRERFLGPRDRARLGSRDELGSVTTRRGGVELWFRGFADRHERGGIPITSNRPVSDGLPIVPGERRTAALRDRLRHRCHVFERNGESDRFREAMNSKKRRKPE